MTPIRLWLARGDKDPHCGGPGIRPSVNTEVEHRMVYSCLYSWVFCVYAFISRPNSTRRNRPEMSAVGCYAWFTVLVLQSITIVQWCCILLYVYKCIDLSAWFWVRQHTHNTHPHTHIQTTLLLKQYTYVDTPSDATCHSGTDRWTPTTGSCQYPSAALDEWSSKRHPSII